MRLSVKPKTKKERKHPAVRIKIVFFEVVVCMMEEIILVEAGLFSVSGWEKKTPGVLKFHREQAYEAASSCCASLGSESRSVKISHVSV